VTGVHFIIIVMMKLFIGNCELDEALFEFFKKKKIKELKSSLSASELNDIRNGKGDLGTHKHEVNHGFNRVSAKYFSEVINALSVEQRKIIVNGKFIPFNKVSVHKVLGTPIGGDSLSVDCEVGKTFILSRFNLSTLPPIRFFGDKIKNKQL